MTETHPRLGTVAVPQPIVKRPSTPPVRACVRVRVRGRVRGPDTVAGIAPLGSAGWLAAVAAAAGAKAVEFARGLSQKTRTVTPQRGGALRKPPPVLPAAAPAAAPAAGLGGRGSRSPARRGQAVAAADLKSKLELVKAGRSA